MSNTVGFALNAIIEEAYWFREPKIDLKKANQELGYNISNNFNIHESENIIDVITNISIDISSPEGKSTKSPPLLNYKAIFQFQIAGINFTLQPDTEAGYEYIQFPEGLLATLVGTAYSTCRGILFTRTAGSQLHEYLLPIANPVAMVQELNNRLRKHVADTSRAVAVPAIEKSTPENKKKVHNSKS